MFNLRMSSKLLFATCVVSTLAFSFPLNAGVLGFWATDGWTVLDADDSVGGGGYVGPGWGGQSFDAEYLFYKQQGTLLSFGLQTGFDLSDGSQWYGNQEYFAGDLALSFNGGAYDYAIDFGLVTRDKDGDNVGLGSGDQDAAGLYSVSLWNNDVVFTTSNPFAMDEGSLLAGISGVTSGSELLADGRSFYRTATIDLAALGFKATSFSAHWTMSCGNDEVEGSAEVPEPSLLLLMAGGLFGLSAGRRRRTRV